MVRKLWGADLEFRLSRTTQVLYRFGAHLFEIIPGAQNIFRLKAPKLSAMHISHRCGCLAMFVIAGLCL